MHLGLIVRTVAQRWVAHDHSRSAAAIGFFAIFTLAPLLVFATTALGLFMGDQEAQSLTAAQLAEAMGPSGAHVAQEVLANADFSRHGVVAPVISVVVLLYGASAVFYQLRNTLDRVFGYPERTTHEAIVALLIGRLTSACCVIIASIGRNKDSSARAFNTAGKNRTSTIQ